jgi:hypothetical protein
MIKTDYKTKDEQIEQWKHEYEVLDACLELTQGKIAELKAENNRLKELKCKFKEYCTCNTEKYVKCLQEIKGVVTALYMNNWLQMNKTARKSIQLLQDLITKAEEEWK